MSNPNETWNPEDGPPPSDDERADAAALSTAVAMPGRRPGDPDVAALLDVALRIRATAHPDQDAARTVAARALDGALGRARTPFSVRRWGWGLAAACALLAAGVGGAQLTRAQVRDAAAPVHAALRTRAAVEVFTAAVEPGAGSDPADRIYEHSLRDFRASLLGGGEP